MSSSKHISSRHNDSGPCLPEGRIVIWGIQPVQELLRSRPDKILDVYTLPSFGKTRPQKHLLESVSGRGIPLNVVNGFNRIGVPNGAVHQGISCIIEEFWWKDLNGFLGGLSDSALLIVCDNITDPHNLGAVIRSAHGLGADGVLFPGRSSAPVTGTVVKASAGALFHLPLIQVRNLVQSLELLKRKSFWVMGLTPEARDNIWDIDLKGKIALVVGAEGKGIRKLVKRTCDLTLKIPLAGRIGSLNVSVAAAIALYEVLRQQKKGV